MAFVRAGGLAAALARGRSSATCTALTRGAVDGAGTAAGSAGRAAEGAGKLRAATGAAGARVRKTPNAPTNARPPAKTSTFERRARLGGGTLVIMGCTSSVMGRGGRFTVTAVITLRSGG